MTSDERLFTGHTGRLLLAVSLGWTAIQTGRLVLSPLLPTIRADLHISRTQAGLAFSLLWGLYALCQYPSGRLSDALSRKTLLVAGALSVLVGFLAFAVAPGYLAFLGAAAIVGLGAGLYPTAARALVSDLFTEKRGRAFGLHTASGDVGGVLSAGLAALVLAAFVWRAAFLPVAVVCGVVAVVIHYWSRERYVRGRPSLAVRDTLARLLGDGEFRWLLVAYALFAFAWQSSAAFLPALLETGKGFDPTVAQAAFAVLFGVGALVKPAAGAIGDRVPRHRVSTAALALAAAALLAVVLARTPATAFAAVVVYAVGLMAYPPVMQAALMDAFPEASAGGDLGATRTLYVGVGALGPTYVGVVADATSYGVAFAGLAGALLCSAGVVLFADY